MKNLFKNNKLNCDIALKKYPILLSAFCIAVPVAMAEPLIKKTDTIVLPSDNSSSTKTPENANAAKGERLTPHRYYKGANPGSESSSDGSDIGATSQTEVTGVSAGTRIRNRNTGIGTGTSYRNDPAGTGTSYREGTSVTAPSDAVTTGTNNTAGSNASGSNTSGTTTGAGSSGSGSSSSSGTGATGSGNSPR